MPPTKAALAYPPPPADAHEAYRIGSVSSELQAKLEEHSVLRITYMRNLRVLLDTAADFLTHRKELTNHCGRSEWAERSIAEVPLPSTDDPLDLKVHDRPRPISASEMGRGR